jgi:type IV pilus assembly protein PilQ
LTAAGLAGLLVFAGCAAQEPHALIGDGASGAADRAEDRIEAAVARMEEGDYAEASELLRGGLQSVASYRVMPELLYLLGQSEFQGGDREKAGLSFSLLRRYYPRRWNVLPDRAQLTALADDFESDPEHGVLLATSSAALIENSTAASASGNAPGSGAANVRISNLFYMTDIGEVLIDVSAQAGVPIVTAAGVRGLVTAEFDEVPLEDCLSRLLIPLGLSYRWMDGYYLVGEADPGKPVSMPLTETVEVRPRHLLAADVPEKLSRSYDQYVRVGGDGGNTLTVTGSPELLRRFMRDLAAIDHPPRQVVIEALVVEVNSDLTREWGIDWEVLGSDGGTTFRFAKLVPSVLDSSFIAQIFDTGIGGLNAVSNVSVALRALEAAGAANIRANPSVATLDGHEARIRVGTEAYYSLLSGSVSYAYYTLQKIATGITLTITPYVGASSEITSDISVEVSDVRASGSNDLPVTSVREVETRARVGNGESVMIGGLLAETSRKKENRIPILGSIPFLGALFGHTSIEKGESELLVLITPHIMIHPTELAGLLE